MKKKLVDNKKYFFKEFFLKQHEHLRKAAKGTSKFIKVKGT